MKQTDLVKQALERISLWDMPIGVYAVAEDGSFAECNKQARKMLGLDTDGEVTGSMKSYYGNLSDRARAIANVQAAEQKGAFAGAQVVPLEIDGTLHWAEVFCRTVRDPQKHGVIGFLGCIVDVSERERLRRLFDMLPAGVYRLDAEDRVVQINDALVKLLRYPSAESVLGRPVSSFFADENEAREFRRMIIQKRAVTNEKVRLLRENGEILFASVSSYAIPTTDGSYSGREGTIIDVSEEEHVRQILDEIPLGTYQVRIENGEEIIRDCNEPFLEMFDFDSPEQARGMNILALYRHPERDHPAFRRELMKKHKANGSLVGYPLEVTSVKGREFTIEVNSRPLSGPTDQLVLGRTGVVRDITEEVALWHFREDIGKMLHAYSSTLMMVRHVVDSGLELLRPRAAALEDLDGLDDADGLESALRDPTGEAIAQLTRLLELVETDERRKDALPLEKWDTLTRMLALFRDYRHLIPDRELWRPALRDAARIVCETLAAAKKRILPREAARAVRRAALAVERLCCVARFRQVRDSVITMDHQVRALREYVTSQVLELERPALAKASALITQAVRNLADFARSRGVDIRRADVSEGARVRVDERSVIRAISNLLHNAIKYSWKRSDDGPRWIAVRCRAQQHQVIIEIENYGVPIPPDEIEYDRVFEVGFRGRLSEDRGRLGTGVGLADARGIARKHDGDVVVASDPAVHGASRTDFEKPFVTIATLTLLVADSEERE